MFVITRYYIDTFIDLSAYPLPFDGEDQIEYEHCREFVRCHLEPIGVELTKLVVFFGTRLYETKRYTCLYCTSEKLPRVIDSVLSYRQTSEDLQYVDNTIINGQLWGSYSPEMLENYNKHNLIDGSCECVDIFDNINKMSSIPIDFATAHAWYNNYMASLQPTNAVGYYYVYLDAKRRYRVSSKTSCITKKMQIKQDLRPYFDGGTDMYLQVTATDVYFVVPKKIGNYVFGDHYRMHHVSQMVPPYDTKKTYSNLIDFHRTNILSDTTGYKTRHDPKCMFHNGSQAPIINNALNFDSIVCFNKVQKGSHYMNRVINDREEYDLVSTLLQKPFEDELDKRKKAANKIKKAWSQRGGSNRYLNIEIDENIDRIHVVYVRHRPNWHVSAFVYNKSGEQVGFYFFVVNRLVWKLVAEKLGLALKNT